MGLRSPEVRWSMRPRLPFVALTPHLLRNRASMASAMKKQTLMIESAMKRA